MEASLQLTSYVINKQHANEYTRKQKEIAGRGKNLRDLRLTKNPRRRGIKITAKTTNENNCIKE